jgi:hypothetical protein
MAGFPFFILDIEPAEDSYGLLMQQFIFAR